MHGVYHIYNEFMTERDEFYVEEGASAFKACFGNYPSRFKAPQLAISAQNRELIEQDYMLDGYINQIIHKIYHCGDSGRLPNWLQDLI